MNFTKMQGAGNDFVLVESEGDRLWELLAREMCDRHYGVGADGLLVMMPSDNGVFKMRIFNADGSESGVCGNGLRCMIRYYLDTQSTSETGDILVETMAGMRRAQIVRSAAGDPVIRTSMGKPMFDESAIPLATGSSEIDIKQLRVIIQDTPLGKVKLYPVSMGNPHAVGFIDSSVDEFPLETLGTAVNAGDIFLKGVNLEIVQVISRNTLRARVWERGVGETLACGSGACAITVAAYLKGYISDIVDIELPGGILNCVWDGKDDVYLSGPAERVFTGEWKD